MIPTRATDLDDLLAEIERQEHEVIDLFQEVSAEGAVWRPDPSRWSMTGHLVHLCVVDETYVEALESAVAQAREAGGPESSGPYRHPWLSRRFARMMEPPPTLRVKTFKAMVPEPDATPDEAVERFRASLRGLAAAVESARGLDLGKVRVSSPFLRLLRFSLGAAFEIVLAHDRRHVWLMREVMESDGFPG